MIPVLTKEQAYKLDKDTIESGHLSQAELMDNAGKAVAQFFCEKIKDPFNQKVVVVCGKGNNGGDGVITHSYLKKYNVSSEIVFTEEKHNHLKLIKKYKISQRDYTIYNDKIKFDKYDWVIDGIFGIGLSRELDKKYEKLFNIINNNKIISIDIPSGFSDNLYLNSIYPLYTIALGYPKYSLFFQTKLDYIIFDIGFQDIDSDVLLLEINDICNIIKPFDKNADKHKYVHESSIIAGSDDMPGAAFLACKSSFVMGSGYVSFYTNKDNNKLIDKINILLPEVVVKDINQNLGFREAPPEYNWLYCGWNLIGANTLIGPGSNPNQLEKYFNHNFLEYAQANNYIFDAGAIKSIVRNYKKSKNKYNNILSLLPENCILTPHWGEFQELLFEDYDNIDLRLSFLNKVQKIISDRIIVLKTFNTFIITKNMIYIMDKGPSTLATAGTGDVLSGILVSLLSQGYGRLEASILGTYLHAEAANYYMSNISKDGMTASDLIECIPHAYNYLRNND